MAEDQLTSDQINALIAHHAKTEGKHYAKYQRYYEGQNETIQDKPAQPEPDNRKFISYGRKAVNTIIGYMFKPGNIIVEIEGGGKSNIIDMLNSEEGQLKEANSATIALTKGLSYKIVWQNENELKYGVLNPDNVIAKYTDDIEPELEEVCYFYSNVEFDYKGEEVVTKTFKRYTVPEIQTYVAVNDENYMLQKKETMPNPIASSGMIPIAQHYINPEKRNLFFHVINLIDLQDEILSTNMANEIQTIANSILAIYGKYLDDEIVDPKTGETDREKWIRQRTKIIDGLQKAQGEIVEWVVKNVQWEGIFGIFDRTNQKIWEMLEIPDTSSENFYSNLSGEAMKYRLMPFENKAAMIEAYYKQGLIEQIKIMSAFPTGQEVDPDKLVIRFERNMPANTKERIEQAVMISQIANKKAAIKYLGEDIIPDIEDVLKEIEKQLELDITDIMSNAMKDEPQATEDDTER